VTISVDYRPKFILLNAKLFLTT